MLIVQSVVTVSESVSWSSPTALGAFATLAAVLVSLYLGVTSMRREDERAEKAREETRRGHDATISAHAYALRRQLREWLSVPFTDDIDERARRARALAAEKSSDPAEERSLRIVTAAPHASPEIGEPARRQYVLFYRATLLLNRAASSPWGRGYAHFDPSDWEAPHGRSWAVILRPDLDRARDLIEECVDVLTEAIDEELLEVEMHLDPDED